MAPAFKGLSSVLQTSSGNNQNKKSRKLFSNKKYCQTEMLEEHKSQRKHNDPIVTQNKDKPNVYIIERPQSNL